MEMLPNELLIYYLNLNGVSFLIVWIAAGTWY